MTVYVLEGADGTGKTTLADDLLSSDTGIGYGYLGVDYVYIHNKADDAKLPGSLYRHYRAQLMDALERPGVTVIDRSFLSEYVYGTVMRSGRPRISKRQAVRLTRWCLRRGIVLVLCEAPAITRNARLIERGERLNPRADAIAAIFSTIAQAPYWTHVDSSSAHITNQKD